MSEVVDQWVDAQGGLERDGDDVVDKYGRTKLELAGDEQVRNYSSGELAGQGRVQEADRKFLRFEGSRRAWDDGPVKWSGEFAAYSSNGRMFIDGPQ